MMGKLCRYAAVCGFSFGMFAASAALQAGDWPQWRGAQHNGVSTEKGLPATWNVKDKVNVKWRVELPGPAGSTPVIAGGKAFVTAPEGNDLLLICVGLDGKIAWQEKIGSGNKSVRGDEGNSCAPSCMTDGKHVWTFMSTGDLACYTVAGAKVWHVNLQVKYGKFDIAFGLTSTPILDAGKLYVQCMYTGASYLACLNAASGEEIWKRDRPSDATAECEHSYASPTIYEHDGQTVILTHGADYVVAHAAKDGAELWRCGGLNPKGKYNPTLRFVASPVAAPGLIVVPSAKNGPVLGLKPGGKGDITTDDAQLAWKRNENTPDVPSPLIHEGLVYLCRENGFLLVLDAKTGEEQYNQAMERDRHRASPVYADGKIYCVARNGTVSVVKAGRTFELLSKNKMEEDVSSSLAIADGTIYIRTYKALYAIGGSAGAE